MCIASLHPRSEDRVIREVCIKHRKSFDFDVFTKSEITEHLRQKVRKVLGYTSRIIKDSTNQIDVITPNNVKVTFVKHPSLPLHPIIKTDSISLFSLPDLASNKAYTIGRRGTWRDYVDLFFLLKEGHVTLGSVIKETEKRFGAEFNQRLFLQQLLYTADLVEFGIDYIGRKYKPQQIIDYFEKVVKDFSKTKFAI